MRLTRPVFPLLLTAASLAAQSWTTVGQNAQHTGLSTTAAQALNIIKWQTPVDENLAGTGATILAHFGAPIITPGNSVLVPVHTAAGGYAVQVFNGATASGAPATPRRTLATDWVPPASTWVPSYAPGLSSRNRFYYPGAGGTVYYLDNPDTNTGPPGQIAFYGTALYQANSAAYQSSVTISTPITGDRLGNIFFGFTVTGANPPHDQNGVALESGIARISLSGAGTWISARNAAGNIDSSIDHVPINCAPALSNDSQTLYFGVSNSSQNGYLVAVNSSTLAPLAQVHLIDPNTLAPAQLLDVSSASPVVGPDGDVFYGVFETACCSHYDRGWMLHFDQRLTTSKTPGSFGWDDTPSVVPAGLVPSYTGHSSYLLLSKYNNYFETGGDGQNRIAILDPNATEPDPVTPAVSVMNEVITILGPTPDSGPPGSVREWCINSAAIDKVNKSGIVNSEDGYLYRWDFTTNTFSQLIRLTSGVGEAYTPTVIGPDGTAYAINDAILFAVRAQ